MLLACWLLLAGLAAPVRAPLIVSAAVSLTDVMQELAAAHERAGGTPLRFNFAASNVLARQIVNGAPADVFISADAWQMDMVERAGAVDPATRVNITGNRLAVLARAGLTSALRTARDLTGPGVRRIALGDPDAVPAGVYAREYLREADVWEAVARRVVPMGSVRAALAAVDNGSVDAAIIYESDTLRTRSATVAFVVSDGPRIVYPAAVVRRSPRREEALQFLAFLRSPQARAIFLRHRFMAVS